MNPAIDVRNLSFKYGDGTDALRGVSFSIASGECVGLIGPNGAGKSTLLLHLNGILPESAKHAGNVIIDGITIESRTTQDVRRRVGLLFQDSNDQIFCPTVYEDVAFGPEQFGLTKNAVIERVADAMKIVGLDGFEKRAPHHLSAGERRRVCLAGVLACDPSIIVFDEPTSGLDPKGRRELKSLLRKIPVTKLVATHDLELIVELCPRVIVMDRGTIVADGPSHTILSNETLMNAHSLEVPHALRHIHPH
jgi:cobalt/nickel transport system ATP-binding protein